MSRRGALALIAALALFGTSATARADASCTVDVECKNPTPVCGPNQTCTACTWAPDCAGRPATPACSSLSGSCVECTAGTTIACRGTTPVCDPDKSKCVGCLGDGDCTAGKTCVNQQCVANIIADAGPVEPPEASVVEAGAPSLPRAGYIEGGGCSTGVGALPTLASAWPILVALLLVTRTKRRR